MKRKQTAAAVWMTVMVAIGIWGFFNFRDNSLNYRLENAQRVEGLQYLPNFVNSRAFASGFDWDGETEEITVVIPDTVEFHNSSRTFRVTKLGGFWDRNIPSAFGPLLPVGSRAGQVIYADSNALESAKERYSSVPERDLTVHLSVGQYVSEIPLAAASLLYREQEGDGVIWRVTYWVDCDENNQTFYSEDGKLYSRADNMPVTRLTYGEDG
ncbi:hypothetical protein [Oscillibacter sp. GMB15532]|uniref:hypothetical protein n=1 Tax=Oscillibacter sp. GMB15532 TaxID=3230022 RepID=UPI0034DFDA03